MKDEGKINKPNKHEILQRIVQLFDEGRGYEFDEIAQMVGLSERSVTTRLTNYFASLKRLKRLSEDRNEEESVSRPRVERKGNKSSIRQGVEVFKPDLQSDVPIVEQYDRWKENL